MSKSIKKNYICNVLYDILTLLTPFVTAPYLSRVLEADGIGTASFIGSIVSYFSLVASMGVGTYGQREISYVQGDIQKRSEVFWNTKVLGCCISGTTMIVYFVFALLQKKDSTLYLIYTLSFLSIFLDIGWFYQGMEEFVKPVARNAIFKLINIGFIFLFIRNKGDLPLYILGSGIFGVLSSLSLWAYMPKYIKKVSILKLKPFKNFRIVWGLFVPSIAVQIYTVLDKTMIGLITNNSYENGYYEQAIKISKMALSVVTALGVVMVPRIGNLFANKNEELLKRYMYRGYRFVWFLGLPMCLGLIMMAGNFVPWFFGAGYEKVIPLLRILSLLIMAIGINNVTGFQYLIPTKRENIFTITVVAGACVNFTLNMVLIYFWDSVGAALASVFAETTIAVMQLVIVRKEISPLKVLQEGSHYFFAGTVMVLVLIPITSVLASSILSTVIIIICGAFTYFITLFIMQDDFFLTNARMVLHMVVRTIKNG